MRRKLISILILAIVLAAASALACAADTTLVVKAPDKLPAVGETFDVEVDEILPRKLYGDDGKIRQIVLNLLLNAVKYTDVGGVILSVSMNERRGEAATLSFSVKDTGMGIKEEEKEKLLHAYERLEEANGGIEATGIGLDISNQKFEAAATGNGPVDAAIKALKKIILKQMTLKEFTIQAISKGSDDVGKVHMQVEYDGSLYYGFGANTDIVTASVEAYIDCINKFRIRE